MSVWCYRSFVGNKIGDKHFAIRVLSIAKMAPKYPRCLQIANQIGDRRVERVLEALFCRERDAYLSDEKEYNKRIEEVKERIEHRHGIIKELKKMGVHPLLVQILSDLKAAERMDFDEMGWLIKKSYVAVLRAADKQRMVEKLKTF